MKKSKIALAIASITLASNVAHATNGDTLIGLGAFSRALGGTGTAAYFGSENPLTNPSLLGKGQGSEFVIGGTIFKPDVKAETNVASTSYPNNASQTSAADLSIIPEVSLSTRLNNNWTFGLGIFGSAGMGTDYRDNGGQTDGFGLFNGYSNLQLMKFAPSFAYNNDNWGVGFAPVIQYGALDINYHFADGKTTARGNSFPGNTGNGMSSDIGYGYNLGGHFDITKDFTVAIAYQSAIDMTYDNQISTASKPFANFGFLNSSFGDNLEQPAEIKIGAAYTIGNYMLTADAKQIQWGDAKGYKDFNWKDQNVFAVGGKYQDNGFWLGAGYNSGQDPIEKLSDSTSNGQTVNMFNNHFFPAVIEQHFTFGGGYSLTKSLALDAAVVYASEVTKTVNTSNISSGVQTALQGSQQNVPSEHKVTHSQTGYTVSLRMNF